LATFCLLCSLAWASEKPPTLIGIEDIDYLPFYHVEGVGEEQVFRGLMKEVFELFSKSSGERLVLQPLPVNRLYDHLKQGKIDMKFPDHPLWGQQHKEGLNVTYSAPIVEYVDGVIALKENRDKGLDWLKTLGTVRGFTPFSYLDLIQQGKVQVTEANNLPSLIKMLKKDRIQGIYANIAVCFRAAGEERSDLHFMSGLPHSKSHYHLSTLASTDSLKRFDDFLKSHSGEVEALKQKYGIFDGMGTP